ncbi:nitrate ABC transporter ATP-binding protein [Nibricoccus aquaticus]|uniref:Nitrate ABC transporter ATP-binding protein n=1 Tax=Nibricoccus aquaticus TaxID=2576891 RepID=A0A290QFA8_9BACT|nr:CmpA/NrtA family ABC transporter substrate-binding protein [Nibricoccus aquaticus]ATC62552.1 nitrate ABC transporter ATP-binding protein [Nibricoccus aquaticus]
MPAVSTNPVSPGSRPLRVGFLALTDAAPFVVAQERGLFAKYGIEVELRREVGWATIREKIIYGELDAAHAPAPMLWATRLGLDSVACPVLTALVLNLHGNALTLSERLWESGIRTPSDLRDEARRRSGERKLTFGVVFMFSSHHLMLRTWLRAAGINPDKDVRIVVVPPAQMFRNLSAGTIDGYCAGEPWNSLAVREKTGWCPAWSAAMQPDCIEKVLMVTEKFALTRPREHGALVSALLEACAWCDEPANREPLAHLLSGPGYINQSTRVILPALQGQFDCGHDRIEPAPDFVIFHRNHANVPTQARATSLQAELVEAGLLPAKAADAQLPGRLFREDLFRQALQHSTHELISH